MRAALHRLLRRSRGAPADSEPYEPELTAAIERVVEPGWSCADVGAHVGNITETLVRLVGSRGRVVAFEAHPTNALELRARFRRARPVEVVNAAVGDGTADRLALYAGRHDNSTEWNVLGHDVEGTPTRLVLEVPAVSLDAWYSPGEPLDFVKIDVEGAEGFVLAGMRRLLREERPVVAVEFHDDEAWVSRHELLDAGYALSRPDGSPIDPAGARVYHVIARPGTR
ncbi:MAG: FkbM family methyltransferase [Gaiellaceae bacterium]